MMNLKDYNVIKESVGVLIGLPTRAMFRSVDMLCLSFGDLIEVEREDFYRRKDGKLARRKKRTKVLVGKYSLHFQCFYRIVAGTEMVLAKEDRFQPSSKIASEDHDSFFENSKYTKRGNNVLDENIALLQEGGLDDFVVKGITVNRLGDLKITFTNGFRLESMSDWTTDDECWRFFESGQLDAPHLVVGSEGIMEG